MDINYGEVWFAKFPLEEDKDNIKPRPVVVLDADIFEVLVVKVIKADSSKNDYFDLPILYWKQAKLKFESIVRVSKTVYLPRTAFDFKIGELPEYDLQAIEEPFKKYIISKE